MKLKALVANKKALGVMAQMIVKSSVVAAYVGIERGEIDRQWCDDYAVIVPTAGEQFDVYEIKRAIKNIYNVGVAASSLGDVIFNESIYVILKMKNKNGKNY